MFCNKCGKQINDISKFCNYCGAPISTPDGVVPVIPQTRLDLEAAARQGIAQQSSMQAQRQAAKPMRPKTAPPDEKKYELAVPSAPKKRQKVELPPTVGGDITAKKFKGLDEDAPFSSAVALSGIPGCKKLVKQANKQQDELYGLERRRKKAAAAEKARKAKEQKTEKEAEPQESAEKEDAKTA